GLCRPGRRARAGYAPTPPSRGQAAPAMAPESAGRASLSRAMGWWPHVALFLVTTAVTALNSVYFKRLLNCFRGGGSDGEPEHDYAVFVSVFDILLWAVRGCSARGARARASESNRGSRSAASSPTSV
ncbi:unnamed protein product, partial [Prorocentrum cordatum]